MAQEDQSGDCGNIEENDHPFHTHWPIAEHRSSGAPAAEQRKTQEVNPASPEAVG
jgi:hypothetical protein